MSENLAVTVNSPKQSSDPHRMERIGPTLLLEELVIPTPDDEQPAPTPTQWQPEGTSREKYYPSLTTPLPGLARWTAELTSLCSEDVQQQTTNSMMLVGSPGLETNDGAGSSKRVPSEPSPQRRTSISEPLLPSNVNNSFLSTLKRRHFDVADQDKHAFFDAKAGFVGLVNAILMLPALLAYAAIVFKDPCFSPYFGVLSKMLFVSSTIHQVSFNIVSGMPFAVGQVQDVGLIFLSSMASSIAQICMKEGRPVEELVATCLLTLSLSTAAVGLLLILVGHFKLAGLMQYVPLPVVGGYLGYVGYFCLASGVGIAAGAEVGDSLSSWLALLTWDPLIKLLPALLACALIQVVVRRCSHPLALPAVLSLVPVSFHIVLFLGGWTLEQAQDAGWVMKASEGGDLHFWELWSLYNPQGPLMVPGVYLPAASAQLHKLVGLFILVCFGSCMDVAAIQQSWKQPLDFDRELMTVGVSNTVTGLLGAGYTGSYIFSQSTFTLRAGVRSKLAGWVLVAVEVLVVVLPGGVVQYIPTLFFGAMLIWFGTDICQEYLYLSIWRLSSSEYLLLLLTFCVIFPLGLQGGILVGVLLSALYFAYAYARSQVQSFELVAALSWRVLVPEQQAVLEALMTRTVAVALKGYIFFGSATSIGNRIMEVAADLVRSSQPRECDESFQQVLDHGRLSLGVDLVGDPGVRGAMVDLVNSVPRHIIIDLSRVVGLDSTAARTFAMLVSSLSAQRFTVIFTQISHKGIRDMLAAHDITLVPVNTNAPSLSPNALNMEPVSEPQLPPGGRSCLLFARLADAVRWCEDQYMCLAQRAGLAQVGSSMTLEKLAARAMVDPRSGSSEVPQLCAVLRSYMTTITLKQGEVLYRAGAPLDTLYYLESGLMDLDLQVWHSAQNLRLSNLARRHSLARRGHDGPNTDMEQSASGTGLHHSFQFGPGSLVGAMDFYLGRPAASSACAASSSCVLRALSRERFHLMMVEAPAALNLLQAIAMRATATTINATVEIIDKSAATH